MQWEVHVQNTSLHISTVQCSFSTEKNTEKTNTICMIADFITLVKKVITRKINQ